MKKTTRVVLGSAMSIAMCASLIAGSTLALFSSEDSVNIAVTSGKVEVTATVGNLKSYHLDANKGNERVDNSFGNDGTTTATESDGTITLTNFAPLDGLEVPVTVTNASSIAIKYQIRVTSTAEGDKDIFDALQITVKGSDLETTTLGKTTATDWQPVAVKGDIPGFTVDIFFPDGTTNNEYQNLKGKLAVNVMAVQGNAHTTDPSEAAPTPGEPGSATTSYIFDATQLKAFAKAVNSGDDYTGKTVKLMDNIDLAGEAWEPISEFRGTFEGNEQTISNLKIERSTEEGVGLFRAAGDNARIQNFTLNNVDIHGQLHVGAVVGGGVSHWELGSGALIDGIKVTGDIKIEGNYKVGGIAGGTYCRIANCSIDGKAGSYIKGVYTTGKSASGTDDLEGDSVGGIIGYIGDSGPSYEDFVSNCHVNGVTVSGTRKVGGIAGYISDSNGVIDSSFKNGTVESNATPEYIASNQTKFFIGGIVGEIAGNKDTPIKGNTVENATIKLVEHHAYSGIDAAILGGSRSASFSSLTNYSDNTVTNTRVLYDGMIILGSNSYGADSAETLLAFNTACQEGKIASVEHPAVAKLVLLDDIDLAGHEWSTIYLNHGVIDGNGHTLKNVEVVADTTYGKAALFGGSGNSVMNLTIENFSAAGEQVAIFCANPGGSHNILNCNVKGTIDLAYRDVDAKGSTGTGYDEEYPAVGVLVGLLQLTPDLSLNNAPYYDKYYDNVVIDKDCVINIDITGMTTLCAKPTTNFLFGYYVTAADEASSNVAGVLAAGKVINNGKIDIKGADTLEDSVGNISVFTPSGFASLGKMTVEELNGKTIYIAQSIDFGGKTTPWEPISLPSSSSCHYTIDGQGNTLSNLYVEKSGDYAGLFASLGQSDAPAKVQNIVFENANISATGDYVGVLAGVIYGDVENIVVKGDVHITGDEKVGGLIGEHDIGGANGLVAIKDCKIEAKAGSTLKQNDGSEAVNGFGGLVGFVVAPNTFTVSGCTVSNLDISSYTNAGGIIGKVGGEGGDIVITDCTVKADIATSEANDYCASGMMGWLASGGLTISNCHYTGRIYWESTLVSEPNGNNNLLTNLQNRQPTITNSSATLLDAEGGEAYTKTW